MAEFIDRPLPAMPVGWTLCSGIGSPEMAAPWIDWRFASEIAPFPRAVLQARFGYALPENHHQGAPLLWGDMSEISVGTVQRRGVPLPDILVAGTPCQAFSIAGARGGLADPRGNLTLKFVRLCHEIQDAKFDNRLCTIWENVPGVLSSRDNAFGCLLGGIVGGGPVDRPDGRSWPRAGMVAGPRGRAAWRVLDAQFFGLAQRRKRVFLVASLGDGPDPVTVLFERARGGGHPAPRRKAENQNRAPDPFGTGSDSRRGRVISSSGDISFCLNAGGMGRNDLESETLVLCNDDSGGEDREPWSLNARQDSAELRGLVGTLDTYYNTHVIGGPRWKLRRLIPAECHVLQGFPVDHCEVEFQRKPATVVAQNRALGNSIAVPVMRWILDRLRGMPGELAPYGMTEAKAAAWAAKGLG